MKVHTARDARRRIRYRTRKKVLGSARRPRLSVYRSLKHIYAQIIDDAVGQTIVAASSREKEVSDGGNQRGAEAVGKLVAERAREKGIEVVVFDRGGFHYHGRIKVLANAAREHGLKI